MMPQTVLLLVVRGVGWFLWLSEGIFGTIDGGDGNIVEHMDHGVVDDTCVEFFFTVTN